MDRLEVAVVGDRDSVLAFKAVGVKVYPVEGELEARETVRELARTCAVIFITEKTAESIAAFLERYKTRPYPAIVPIPSAEGSTGMGMAGIRKDVERAIGADILFGKDDKK